MADEPRMKSNGQPPLTRHPLFPATVALWFSALFGLGSLAIRPSLLETMVVSLHLDAVISSMASPLGATARILLALAMAILGCVLGTALARKLAGPGSKDIRRKSRGFGIASVFGKSKGEPAPRRRSLAIKDEPARRSYEERVPVPGAALKILDVAEFDLDGFEDETEPSQLPAQEPQAVPEIQRADAQSQSPETFAEQLPEPATPEPEPAPVAPMPAGDAPFGAPADVDEDEDEDEDEQSAWPGVKRPVAFDVERKSDPPTEDITANTPGQTGQAGLPRFDLNDRGNAERLKLFEQEPAQPLFREASNKPASAPTAQEASAPQPETPQQAAPLAAPSSPQPGEQAPPVNESTTAEALPEGPDAQIPIEPQQEAETVPASQQPIPASKSNGTAVARIADADPDALSNVELLERLALALKRRREAPPASGPAEATAPAERSVPESRPAPAPEPAPQDFVSEATEPPQPEAQPVPEADVEPEVAAATGTATPPFAEIPAALRPVGLDADEDDLLPSYVPPRHIGPAAPDAAGFAAPETGNASNVEADSAKAAERSSQPAVAREIDAGDDLDDEQALDEGYSSLLNLSRPGSGSGKQQFVRIEEPLPDNGEIEPVVVFPGQAATTEAPFAKPRDTGPETASDRMEAQPEPAFDPDGPPPFAPPAEEKAENQASAPFAPPAEKRDPEETERALRSALATLQRMSGAA